jgi:uncharacterized OB-fold protein
MSQLKRRDDVAPGPPPLVHPENQPFWESLDEGLFRLQRCDDCGVTRFPVAPCCWQCLSTRSTWEEADGSGTVAVAVRVERAVGSADWHDAVPFLSGLVDANAGVRLPGRILCICGKGADHGAEVTMIRIPTRADKTVYGFEHACAGATP